ncbi:hypothetical protein BH23ACT10_BH23ACT10_11090 [soil metagenome]
MGISWTTRSNAIGGCVDRDRLNDRINGYAEETGRSLEWVRRRVAVARSEYDATGTYTQSYDEAGHGRARRVAQQRAVHRPVVLA